MRIRALQHVPFEDIGSMTVDFHQRGSRVDTTYWYLGDASPPLESFDMLLVMGGPMGVYDEQEYPWLAVEKELIRSAIAAGKVVIGICLGAQLIACASGAEVTRNRHREIGWFPLTGKQADDPVSRALDQVEVFHWHGDTFDLPSDAVWLASSEACPHQAFRLGDRVFGFQFHLETTPESAAALIRNCEGELDGSRYVQDAVGILRDATKFAQINRTMSAVLRLIIDR